MFVNISQEVAQSIVEFYQITAGAKKAYKEAYKGNILVTDISFDFTENLVRGSFSTMPPNRATQTITLPITPDAISALASQCLRYAIDL